MQFLVGVSLLVAFSCLLPPHTEAYREPEEEDELECNRSVDVAIVGAGTAGTYAAYKLRNANLSIELLEYSNRIGGRTYSCQAKNSSEVLVELGTMKFIQGKHVRVEQLVGELGLTAVDFLEGRAEEKTYFLRGQTITSEQIQSGDLPFRLSAKEKANQGRLAQYYLSELTGYNGNSLTDDQAKKLTVEDGRPLYKLRINEALDMVATEEGKELLRALGLFDGLWAENASASAFFHAVLGDKSQGKERTIKEGMSKIAERLSQAFLSASQRHKLTLHRKLESIQKSDEGDYQLLLIKTAKKEGSIIETSSEDVVCAHKVILAIPQMALTQLNWKPLKTGKVREALSAVMPVKSSKVYMTFQETNENKRWWSSSEESNSSSALKTDTPISQILKWKVSEDSKELVLLASQADMSKAEFLEYLNSEGAPHPASSTSDENRVTNSLVQEVLSHVSEALGKSSSEIKSPVKVRTKFWSKYPFGGCWSILKAGYNPDDVKQTIQQPSLSDEVYIVGSDFAFFQSNTWGLEASLASVDEVREKYCIKR